MTDETAENKSDNQTEEASSTDARFEVKWQKKGHTAPQPDIAPRAESADIEELRRELEAERKRTGELQERWQRAAADLVNLRKRTEQEQGDREKFASMVLVYELLPALDNFERALATIPGNLAMLTWIQGVMLIQRQIQAILEHQGLAAIEAQGQAFNPSFHEAIGERETADTPPGTIVQEYQRGYTMHGRVIRPALVELAKAPANPESSDPSWASEPAPAAHNDVFVADPEAAGDVSASAVSEAAENGNLGP